MSEERKKTAYFYAIPVLAILLTTGFLAFFANTSFSKYRAQFTETLELTIHPEKPVLASGADWYRAKTVTKKDISDISFVTYDYQIAAEDYVEAFYADEKGLGTIKAYITKDIKGRYRLLLSGNGFGGCDTIYANADSAGFFKGFTAVAAIHQLDRMDTGGAGSFAEMFSGCASLEFLDLSHWDTACVMDFTSMFNGCTGLRTVYTGPGFTTTAASGASPDMFKNCILLSGGAGTAYNSDHTDAAYAAVDLTGQPGYFTGETVELVLHGNIEDADETLTLNFLPDCAGKDAYVLPTANWIERPGYELRGFGTTADADEPVIFKDETDGVFYFETCNATHGFCPCSGKTAAAPVELFAIWAPYRYMVTLNPMGGTLSEETMEVVYGMPYGELPAPTRAGYTFAGWAIDPSAEVLPNGYTALEYLESNGSGSPYINTGYKLKNKNRFRYEIDVMPANGESSTCECGAGNQNAWSGQRWNGLYYVLGSSFKLQEGLNRQAGVRELFAGNVEGNDVTLTREVGKAVYTQVEKGFGGSAATNRPWLLFAYSFNNDGPSGVFSGRIYSFKLYDSDSLALDLIPVQTDEGKTGMFDTVSGQFFRNAGGGMLNGPEITWTLIDSDATVSVSRNHTLFAQWEPNAYTVTLDANDTEKNRALGMLPEGSFEVYHNSTFALLPELTRPGFDFLGWFDAAGNEVKPTDTFLFTENITLTAHWGSVPFKIRLFTDGGSIEADGWEPFAGRYEKIVLSGVEVALPAPEREGYEFAGWSSNALPDGAARLEYIQGGGGAYIDTGYRLKNGNDFRYEIDLAPAYGESTSCECGAGNQNAWSGQRYNGTYYVLGGSFGLNTGLRREANVREYFTSTIDGSTVTLTRTAGGKTYTQVATGRGGSATTARNFLIFGYTFNSDSCSGGWAGKVYSLKLYDGGELVRNMIPARNDEGKVGMYDFATSTFYPNSGSDFTAGPELGAVSGQISEDGKTSIWSDLELVALWTPLQE